MTIVRAFVAGIVLLSITPAAQAQDLDTEEARGAFTAGQAAYRAGRFADALDYFERAYELTSEPQLLYNIALVHERLRHDAEALDYYRRYLAESPQVEDRANVEARVSILENALREPARVDPVDDVRDRPQPEVAPADRSVRTEEPAPSSGYRFGAPRVGTWIAAGLALASFGAAVGTWLHATSTYDGLRGTCGTAGCSDQDIDDSGVATAIDATTALLITGGVLGAAALVLFFVEPIFASDSGSETVALQIGPGLIALRAAW